MAVHGAEYSLVHRSEVSLYYDRLKKLPRAAGCEEILMPREHEDRITRTAEKMGIPLTKQIKDSLYLESQRCGVSYPAVFGEDWKVDADSGGVVFAQ